MKERKGVLQQIFGQDVHNKLELRAVNKFQLIDSGTRVKLNNTNIVSFYHYNTEAISEAMQFISKHPQCYASIIPFPLFQLSMLFIPTS